MNKVLSIISLLSAGWSYILLFILDKLGYLEGGFKRFLAIACLVYIIVLLYNIFTLRYCIKVQRIEKYSSKIPTTIAIVGTTLYIFIAALSLFFAWLGTLM